MSKEELSSDRLNYLIWRYLLECGYHETAVKLQKEWNVEEPQKQLDFAPHVKNYALVQVVNKGLLYNASERRAAEASPDLFPNVPLLNGFFGPLTLPPRPPVPLPPKEEDDTENARKRPIVEDAPSEQNGPAKRPRIISNGYENGTESVAGPKSPMDVDEEPANGHGPSEGNAYPSPEQLPSPIVPIFGSEKGTQADKVADLVAETTFIDLADESSSASRPTVLLQCEFNPRNPNVLAAVGTDALARIWTLSHTASGSDVHMENNETPQPPPKYISLLDGDFPSNTQTVALSWAANGSYLAVATEGVINDSARVRIQDNDGVVLASYDGLYASVVFLRWNPSDTLLLALSPGPEGAGTIISVMPPASPDIIQYKLPHDLEKQPLEAVWTGTDEFVICGGELLQGFQIGEGKITIGRKFETRDCHALSRIAFDPVTNSLATASETGTVDLWDPNGQVYSFNAHQANITALVWQPLPATTTLSENSERLLASAGDDGAISIWNIRSLSRSKCSMTMGLGVVALAFTPDGSFIAGATNDRVLIWKVGEANVPRASWIRGPEPGWQSPRSSDSGLDEDQHCLCWDSEGHKLAYGVNSLLATINFR
ncbi:WD40-repeat-containing domain protein [Bisporella sp. PMI_857]|nr:WD40-repeat-containing domain protein [Bisporella sp. PMI_857]